VFVDQGHVADVFGPGTYTIDTPNLPVLTDLRHWGKGFQSPFKSEVYFFSSLAHDMQRNTRFQYCSARPSTGTSSRSSSSCGRRTSSAR